MDSTNHVKCGVLDPIENLLYGECYETPVFDKSAEYLDKYTPGTYITKVDGVVRPVLSSDESIIGCITRGIEKDNHSEYGRETIVCAVVPPWITFVNDLTGERKGCA